MAEKKPWEMTRAEYVASRMPSNAMGGGASERIAALEHAREVQIALGEDQRPLEQMVLESHELIGSTARYPEDILRDYPELAKRVQAAEIPSLETGEGVGMMGRGAGRAFQIRRLGTLEDLRDKGCKKVQIGSRVMRIEAAIKNTERKLDVNSLIDYSLARIQRQKRARNG